MIDPSAAKVRLPDTAAVKNYSSAAPSAAPALPCGIPQGIVKNAIAEKERSGFVHGNTSAPNSRQSNRSGPIRLHTAPSSNAASTTPAPRSETASQPPLKAVPPTPQLSRPQTERPQTERKPVLLAQHLPAPPPRRRLATPPSQKTLNCDVDHTVSVDSTPPQRHRKLSREQLLPREIRAAPQAPCADTVKPANGSISRRRSTTVVGKPSQDYRDATETPKYFEERPKRRPAPTNPAFKSAISMLSSSGVFASAVPIIRHGDIDPTDLRPACTSESYTAPSGREEIIPKIPVSPLDRGTFSKGKSRYVGIVNYLKSPAEIPPHLLAYCLTLMEWTIFSQVPAEAFLTHNPKTPHAAIVASKDFFNYFTRIVEISILGDADQDPASRAQTIHFWSKVATRLRRLNNFQTLKAVLSALGTPPVVRLKKTWAYVSRKSMGRLEDLTALMSEDANYGEYRQLVASLACIPLDNAAVPATTSTVAVSNSTQENGTPATLLSRTSRSNSADLNPSAISSLMAAATAVSLVPSTTGTNSLLAGQRLLQPRKPMIPFLGPFLMDATYLLAAVKSNPNCATSEDDPRVRDLLKLFRYLQAGPRYAEHPPAAWLKEEASNGPSWTRAGLGGLAISSGIGNMLGGLKPDKEKEAKQDKEKDQTEREAGDKERSGKEKSATLKRQQPPLSPGPQYAHNNPAMAMAELLMTSSMPQKHASSRHERVKSKDKADFDHDGAREKDPSFGQDNVKFGFSPNVQTTEEHRETSSASHSGFHIPAYQASRNRTRARTHRPTAKHTAQRIAQHHQTIQQV